MSAHKLNYVVLRDQLLQMASPPKEMQEKKIKRFRTDDL